jgi:hypothetical protein
VADVIAAVSGVLLTPADAELLVGALDEFTRVLAEQRSRPTPTLAFAIQRLRKATQECGDWRGNGTAAQSSRADQADTPQSLGYATVTTAEASRILNVGTSAVRNMAQRNPRKLGSRLVGSRWVHDLARVEHRAARTKGR